MLFLAAAAVGGSRDGVERSGSKPRLFKGILICNDQRHYGLTLTAGRAACSFQYVPQQHINSPYMHLHMHHR